MLLDTSLLLRYARQDTLSLWIEATYNVMKADLPPLISIVSVGEILSLALQFHWGEARQAELKQLLDNCLIVPIDLAGIVDAYSEVDAYSIAIGRKVGENDAWIAATARVTGARLLTTDLDFDHLSPGHILRDWIDPNNRL
jgi:tRNA(fMet)-specific endonuclease VapC